MRCASVPVAAPCWAKAGAAIRQASEIPARKVFLDICFLSQGLVFPGFARFLVVGFLYPVIRLAYSSACPPGALCIASAAFRAPFSGLPLNYLRPKDFH